MALCPTAKWCWWWSGEAGRAWWPCQDPGANGRAQRAAPVPCVWGNVSIRNRWAELWQHGLDLMHHFSSVSTCLGEISFYIDYSCLQENFFTAFFLAILFALWCFGVISDKLLSFGPLIQAFLVLTVFCSWLQNYRSTWTGALGWALALLELPALTTSTARMSSSNTVSLHSGFPWGSAVCFPLKSWIE